MDRLEDGGTSRNHRKFKLFTKKDTKIEEVYEVERINKIVDKVIKGISTDYPPVLYSSRGMKFLHVDLHQEEIRVSIKNV